MRIATWSAWLAPIWLPRSPVVLLVVLVLTGPLAYLPISVLATVVFLIGIDLIDVAGLRRIYTVRREEFLVAALTAAAVFIGVEQGVLLAIVASIVDHLRHSYDPRSSVLVKSAAGHWQSMPITVGTRTTDGLVIYRFGTSLYFANASRLAADISTLTGHGDPPESPAQWAQTPTSRPPAKPSKPSTTTTTPPTPRAPTIKSRDEASFMARRGTAITSAYPSEQGVQT